MHKAVFLEGTICMPLAIEVHAGRTSKSTRLDFECESMRAPNEAVWGGPALTG
jgi:hypothetical protein